MANLRSLLKDSTLPALTWPGSLMAALLAVVCFQLAYGLVIARFALFMFGYAIFLTQLARQKTARRAFYAGLAVGFLCVAPQLGCFWNIFGPGALALWLILAFWVAMFTGTLQGAISRFGLVPAALLAPFLWTGFEFFRSELYFLKFSWLNVGYAFSGASPAPLRIAGVYGMGFLAFAIASAFLACRAWAASVILAVAILTCAAFHPKTADSGSGAGFCVAGVQMEFPNERHIPLVLDRLIATYPQAQLLVLSEYTLDGPVPEFLKQWCRQHGRFLVIGGKDPAPGGKFYDSAFVVGPGGDVIFRQAKCVPIQFFNDGLPAQHQGLWNSPWGKIGICICYDLSYCRVTDPLVQMGAQMLIVPTMDVVDWGRREHVLHGLVAPVRAAEYGIPIFRVASSGVSQGVNARGVVLAKTSIPGDEEMLCCRFGLPPKGTVPPGRGLGLFSVVLTALVLLYFAGSNWLKARRAAGLKRRF